MRLFIFSCLLYLLSLESETGFGKLLTQLRMALMIKLEDGVKKDRGEETRGKILLKQLSHTNFPTRQSSYFRFSFCKHSATELKISSSKVQILVRLSPYYEDQFQIWDLTEIFHSIKAGETPQSNMTTDKKLL